MLAGLARRNDLILLIGADPGLAETSGADGVHWPERLLPQAARWRLKRPGVLMTAAAHSRRALVQARQSGMDAAFLSPVLPSRSPSATHPLGLWRAAAIARSSALPVFGLGGLDMKKAKRLKRLGLAGVAMIDGWLGA